MRWHALEYLGFIGLLSCFCLCACKVFQLCETPLHWRTRLETRILWYVYTISLMLTVADKRHKSHSSDGQQNKHGCNFPAATKVSYICAFKSSDWAVCSMLWPLLRLTQLFFVPMSALVEQNCFTLLQLLEDVIFFPKRFFFLHPLLLILCCDTDSSLKSKVRTCYLVYLSIYHNSMVNGKW